MKKTGLVAILSIIGIYVIFYLLNITCPIKYVTGISCAGCGMTRAWISLLKGDINSAFYYHPLFAMPLIWAIIFLFRKKLSKKIFRTLLWITITVFLVVYIYRMLYSDGCIVGFNPSDGIIFKAIKNTLNY